MNKIIKLLDIFSTPMNLKFKGKSKSHQSLIGGVSSILIVVIVIIYTGLNIQKMVSRQQSTISTTSEWFDPGTLGAINYKDMDVLFFVHLSGSYINKSLSLHKLQQYVHVYYQVVQVYNGTVSKTQINAKFCTADDFGSDENSF